MGKEHYNHNKMTRIFKIYPIWGLLGFFMAFSAQSALAVTATVQGSLPAVAEESSGLDFAGTNAFWTHNDGYGDNRIYRITGIGTLQQTVTITGAVNADWEDLAHDAGHNYMYIGDFGNNACNRTNLKIYRIAYPNAATTTAAASVINYTYSDQTCIPSAWLNFDVEAFIHFNGNLYLFTKTDGSAIGYTKMYRLSDDPGTHVAQLVDSFYTNDRTTAADINEEGTALVLMSNSHIHVFKNFTGDNFFNGQHTQVNISGAWSQKEGIAFSSSNEVYITDENNGSGNYLYYIYLGPYIPASTINAVNEMDRANVSVYPNPAVEEFHVNLDKSYHSVTVQLFDIIGKTILSTSYSSVQTLSIDVSTLPRGVYIYKVITDGREAKTDRLLIQ
jgi:hypothetical protein